jgi:hypothetical protein
LAKKGLALDPSERAQSNAYYIGTTGEMFIPSWMEDLSKTERPAGDPLALTGHPPSATPESVERTSAIDPGRGRSSRTSVPGTNFGPG